MCKFPPSSAVLFVTGRPLHYLRTWDHAIYKLVLVEQDALWQRDYDHYEWVLSRSNSIREWPGNFTSVL